MLVVNNHSENDSNNNNIEKPLTSRMAHIDALVNATCYYLDSKIKYDSSKYSLSLRLFHIGAASMSNRNI